MGAVLHPKNSNKDIIIALEMINVSDQKILNQFMTDKINEEDFLKPELGK